MGQMTEIRDDFNKFMSMLARDYPDESQAFMKLLRVSERSGALDHKTKELISLALAVAAHCDGCIAVHVAKALQAGATRDEIMESTFVAVLMGGGPAMVYAKLVHDAVMEYTA
jgi:AhpD family alkylhydroperoxidase